MPELRVAIADDEPLVREGLREFLAGERDVALVAECANGLEALAAVEAGGVDLLLLDIQMPSLDGIGVAEALTAGGGPHVVFVTAFDRHAVRAFELGAVDYLLKPFDEGRFRAALARARERIASGQQAALNRQLAGVLAELERQRGRPERLLVRGAGRLYFVAVEEIDWIEAADNYVRLHVGNAVHVLRETIGNLEARLDPARFARIHRSAIVALARVRQLEPTFNGEYVVTLTTGRQLTLSRTYRDVVKQRLAP